MLRITWLIVPNVSQSFFNRLVLREKETVFLKKIFLSQSIQLNSCRLIAQFCYNRIYLGMLKSNMTFEADKQKFLSIPQEEKRKFYKGEVTILDQIPTWPEYWKKNKSSIKAPALEAVETVDFDLANKISIWQGDITSLEIDAIVNAANSSLLGGGGVDGAIHRAAGPNLKKECSTLGGCHVGEAKITGGYMLPAKYVIHTVGPQGEKPEKLRECYQNSLTISRENKLCTIAFPCISTGVYGYPQKPAANVAISTVKKFLIENKGKVDRVIFCLFLKSDKMIYEELLQTYFATE